MLRKELRRHERRETLRRRLLAGSTAVILALGMAAGGAAPAFATPPGNGGGSGNGTTCDKIGYEKPDSLDNLDERPMGTESFEWGTISWDGDQVDWTLNVGYDVDLCIKGGNTGGPTELKGLTAADVVTEHTHDFDVSHLGFQFRFDYDWRYAAPTCDGITIVFPENLPAGQQGVIEINARFDFGTLNYKVEGDRYTSEYPDGHAGVTLTVTWDMFRNGSLPQGPYTVEWIQVHGTNYHWEGEVTCGGQLPDLSLIEPDARHVPIECDTEGSYTLDDIMIDGERAVQWYYFIGDTKPTDLSEYTPTSAGTVVVDSAQTVHVKAVPIGTYGLEPGATDEWTFVFTEPQDCPALECIPDEYISYTYIRSGASANTGVVTVEQPQGRYSDELCRPLYVTAAAWAFNVVDKVWTQTLVVANRINDGNAITKVGVYPYGAPVGCGQGDIYASRTAFPNPSPLLLGPNQPAWPEGVTPWAFSEIFLHDMKFSGPNPTWVVTPPGCNAVEPVVPTASIIEKCDTDGSLSLTTSPYISYLVRDAQGDLVATVAFDAAQGSVQVTVPDATSGSFTITPVAVFPYILKNYDASDPRWSPDLGERYDCPVEVEPVAQKSTCATGGASILLPPVEGVLWFVNGVKTPGSMTAIPVLEAGPYTVTAELDPDAEGGPFVFAPDAETEWPFVFTDAEICELPELPITNASIGFIDPTCDEGQRLDRTKLLVDDEALAKLERYEEFDDGSYEVVFITTDEDARFFDSSTSVEGRVVSDGGTVLTFTGKLAGPLTGDDCVRSIVVVDPYGVDDRCLAKPTYWIELIEGITYTITVDDEAPVVVEWAGTDERRTFPAERGSTVRIEAAPASELFTLAPQPGPLNHTFAVYPADCLPTLPLTEGSVTFTPATCLDATNWVVLPNVDGVQWWVDGDQTAAGKWPMAAGDVVVEATPMQGYGFSAEAETRWEYTFPTADEACDLSSLAETGASNALVGIGLAAVLITLAGFGVVIGRRFQQA